MPFSIFETDISLPEPVKQAALEFLPSFVSAEDNASLQECALRIADAFGDSSGFSPLLGEKTPERDGAESRMTESGFLEYAVRVDPDFGFFWFYITSLGNADAWSGEKCRTAVFLGLYFLANF